MKNIMKKTVGVFLMFFGIFSAIPFFEWYCEDLHPFLEYSVRYWEHNEQLMYFYMLAFIILGTCLIVEALLDKKK